MIQILQYLLDNYCAKGFPLKQGQQFFFKTSHVILAKANFTKKLQRSLPFPYQLEPLSEVAKAALEYFTRFEPTRLDFSK